MVFINVVGRYGFGFSFGWADELSRFAMIWTAFLGAGLALRYGQLVAVEALQSLLPRHMEIAVRAVSALIIAGFLLALLILGILFMEFSWDNRTPVLRVSRALPYLAIPLGATMALIHLGFGFLAYLRQDWLLLEELDPDLRMDQATGEDPVATPSDGAAPR
jgi:TRAP-type C4-dicarboxylate transport system permease small subunit